ncbi:enoyl-CoA hydratase/isomerase family protein [Nitratireductor basaltis]|uniref:3-hydroxyisobutyryl-CoA hydrolase n=1 Tax=Nitratireductor basaltis TaxID=472175 RepID=A0A084UBX5_9HYPH|nr:enoyl-CoA hydratase/isomerase family protein [Nitratireductor basaltis]KFB10461.1 3-hydroxyisobutyryl-CoA hydrolase [Nitratireductor basaltis]
METDFGGGEDVLFSRRGKAGIITLNRPKPLNAINHSMIKAIASALEAWRQDDQVQCVILKGEGRAFSAGGDIVAVYREGRAGNSPHAFFADEYRLNSAIAHYPKPYVSLIDGIVMGGGVGLSFHGSHPVITENALFAMPETAIGFFPDVGGGYLLSQLGAYGRYLGLTGHRIAAGDLAASGLIRTTVATEALPQIEAELCDGAEVDALLARHAIHIPRESDKETLAEINDLFSRATLEEIVEGLEASGSDFAKQTLEMLSARSPTSLRVTFRQITRAEGRSIDDCLVTDYRILRQMLIGHDFYEGVRAALVDKSRDPSWQPATLEDVGEDEIERYFSAPEGGDLEL